MLDVLCKYLVFNFYFTLVLKKQTAFVRTYIVFVRKTYGIDLLKLLTALDYKPEILCWLEQQKVFA